MKRCSLEIIAEILQVAKRGAKKTRIKNSCGFNYRFTREYLTLLLDMGLLKTGSSYHTTEKGMHFLKTYQNLELLLETGFSLGPKSGKP